MDQVSAVSSGLAVEMDPGMSSSSKDVVANGRDSGFSSVLGDARQAAPGKENGVAQQGNPLKGDLKTEAVNQVNPVKESGRLMPESGKVLPPGIEKAISQTAHVPGKAQQALNRQELQQQAQYQKTLSQQALSQEALLNTDVDTAVTNAAVEKEVLSLEDAELLSAGAVENAGEQSAEEAPELPPHVFAKSPPVITQNAKLPVSGMDLPVAEPLSKDTEVLGKAGVAQGVNQQPELQAQARNAAQLGASAIASEAKTVQVAGETSPAIELNSLESKEFQQLLGKAGSATTSASQSAGQQPAVVNHAATSAISRGVGFGETLTASEFKQAPAMDFTSQVDAEGWGDEFSTKVRWLINGDFQSANLKLKPAELGSMNIRIVMEGDQARLHIVVQQASAREAVENALPRLRDFLEQDGLSLAHSDVEHQEGNSGEWASEEGVKKPWDIGSENDSERLVQDGDIQLSGQIKAEGLVDYYI